MIFPTCQMINTCRDTGDQTECGKRSVYSSKTSELYCCKECFDAMNDEPDLQADFNYVGMPR